MGREKYKKEVKGLAFDLYGRLEGRKKSLKEKTWIYAQAVADLEFAIMSLHVKHSKEIV